MTRFESSPDGPKSTSTKITDIEGVLVEEVLSEPEQEQQTQQHDVFIEEVLETEGNENFISKIMFIIFRKRKEIHKETIIHVNEATSIYIRTLTIIYFTLFFHRHTNYTTKRTKENT